MSQSIPVQQRVQLLDILRGIAIIGILLNNVYAFSGYGFVSDEYRQQHFSTFKFDMALNFLQIMLVEGKFYTMFSLLFGIGFSIILARNADRGINPLIIFYRRIFLLLLIGAAHLYLLWPGDILFLYGLLGLFLPLFRNCSDRTLLIWGVALICSPIVIDAVKVMVRWEPGQLIYPIAYAMDARSGITEENFRFYLFSEGSGWAEWQTWQQSGFLYRYGDLLNSNRLPKVLGIFIIGFYAGRKMIHARLQEYRPLLLKIMKWGFMIGLPSAFAMAFFEGDDRKIYQSPWGLLDTFFYAASVVPLSLAYIAFISLLSLKVRAQRRLQVLAPMGRMALTNYLAQTLMAILIFYGAGLGLGLKFGLLPVYLIVAGICLFQILYSNLWFRYFDYGPIEWIWRVATYGKWLPIRRKKLSGAKGMEKIVVIRNEMEARDSG